jgi:hypothetical protein
MVTRVCHEVRLEASRGVGGLSLCETAFRDWSLIASVALNPQYAIDGGTVQ